MIAMNPLIPFTLSGGLLYIPFTHLYISFTINILSISFAIEFLFFKNHLIYIFTGNERERERKKYVNKKKIIFNGL